MPLCMRPNLPALSGLATRPLGFLPPTRPLSATRSRHDQSGQVVSPNLGRNVLKRRRSSPTNVLIGALDAVGQHHAVPQLPPQPKIDMSYVKLGKHNRWQLSRYHESYARHSGETDKLRLHHSRGKHGTSLQSIAANIIMSGLGKTPPSSDKQPRDRTTSNPNGPNLTPRELAYLEIRKYTIADVHEWVSILTDNDGARAARRLLEYHQVANAKHAPHTKPLPVFVFLFLLRRPLNSFNPEALSSMLVHAWHEIRRKQANWVGSDTATVAGKHFKFYQLDYPTMTDSSVMIMIVRLLRHARHIWPESLVTISHMFTANFHPSHLAERQDSSRRLRKRQNATLARLAASYNRALSLLSLPSTAASFTNTPFHQTAQFEVLRKMAEHKPPITITREGYQAVIGVHLASKKTPKEQDWDSLKAKSWPPWKEERTGLDSEKGPEYGVSMAMEAMRHATAAGYALSRWEKIGQILAGWDLDQTPTIQTRTMLLHRYVSQYSLLREFRSSSNETTNDPEVWAARVRATRTVQEAWACFLSYNDLRYGNEQSHPSAMPVYKAMLEKLAAAEVDRSVSERDAQVQTRELSGGDGREVFATPHSPKEATFVRSEPPNLDGLATEMFTRNLFPTKHTLGLLISGSKALTQGVKYIRWASKFDPSLASLLSPPSKNNPSLKKVYPKVFNEFIRLLCRFSLSYSSFEGEVHKFVLELDDPLGFAIRLLKAYEPVQRMPYYTLLQRLSSTGTGENKIAVARHALERYLVSREIFQMMSHNRVSLDAEGLRIECLRLEKAIFAAFEIAGDPSGLDFAQSKERIAIAPFEQDTLRDGQSVISVVREVLHAGAVRIRSQFKAIMNGSQPREPEMKSAKARIRFVRNESLSLGGLIIPRLLESPRPHLLHQYARVLGLLRDHQGLLALLEWMSKYRVEIDAAAAEPRAGSRQLRTCLVAVRVFAEGAWADREHSNNKSIAVEKILGSRGVPPLSAPAPMLDNMRKLVESLGWGGWPSNEEVEEYVQQGKFPEDPGLLLYDQRKREIKVRESGKGKAG